MRWLAMLFMLAGCSSPSPPVDPGVNWPTELPERVAQAPLDTIPAYLLPRYVQIVSACGVGDRPSFAPPWAGPPAWPSWLAEGERWLTPDGEITHWAAVLDEGGTLMWGVCLLNNGNSWRVIKPWSPSPLNRVYDPCNYVDHLGEPGYPGECMAARAISEPTIALVRNPLTGITLPRERKHCWMSDAGVLMTVAPLDSVGPWRPFIEGRNILTGKPGRSRIAAAPTAGEWTPLASGVIALDGEPDPIPESVLARARAFNFDEEYRNPGWISVGFGGMAATWPVDSLNGMYREPDGWIRKVRIVEDGRSYFLRVRDRDSTIVQPWIPSWSPSYAND